LSVNHHSSKTAETEKYWRSIYEIYTKHRDAFDNRLPERSSPRLSSSSIDQPSLSNHVHHCTPAETFDEFLSQYVMHIAHETNVVSRIAVKSHSPLLSVKHPHHSHDYQSSVQTFDKTLNEIVERI
jgi:hypothetical protein